MSSVDESSKSPLPSDDVSRTGSGGIYDNAAYVADTPAVGQSSSSVSTEEKEGLVDQGRYGRHFLPEPTEQCGYMLTIWGGITLIGGTLETCTFDKYSRQIQQEIDSYSWIDYSGYWCGVVVRSCFYL